MVKQKLTDAEAKLIEEQLKQYVKPKTLPDVIRRAILMSRWLPDKYEIYIPKDTSPDGKEHFISAETALKHLEDNSTDDLDKIAIKNLLSVPKIASRIDYDFRGLLTRVKNSQIIGLPEEKAEDIKDKRKKHEVLDLVGNSKTPMKDLNAQPVIVVKKIEVEDDTASKEPYSGDTESGRANSGESKRDSKLTEQRKGITFDDTED
jgi:hypothetical protein